MNTSRGPGRGRAEHRVRPVRSRREGADVRIGAIPPCPPPPHPPPSPHSTSPPPHPQPPHPKKHHYAVAHDRGRNLIDQLAQPWARRCATDERWRLRWSPPAAAGIRSHLRRSAGLGQGLPTTFRGRVSRYPARGARLRRSDAGNASPTPHDANPDARRVHRAPTSSGRSSGAALAGNLTHAWPSCPPSDVRLTPASTMQSIRRCPSAAELQPMKCAPIA